MWSVLIICCFNSGLLLLMGLAVVLQWRREARAMARVEGHEASLHTLASAVDHLVAHNNMLVGEVTRRKRKGSSSSL